jgi:hypothetical protein
MSAELMLLAALAGLGWFWWDSLMKRELALKAARRLCEQANVQLLDDSIALRKLTLRRDASQQARVYREFAFEYSTVGDDRQAGRVYLLGARVVGAHLLESAH